MQYPRLRDLPEPERNQFREWLRGKTVPVCDETEPRTGWDWYYPWDYIVWKEVE